jgi:RNA polymerase sigma-70 factor (ECF subfamily)
MHTPLVQQDVTDAMLLEQARDGQQSAFETLVARYQPLLYRFVRARVGSEQAYDVLQFVWFQLYQSMAKLSCNATSQRKEASLKPWLFRIAWNRCIDEQRKHKRHPWTYFSEIEQEYEEEGAKALPGFVDMTPLPEELAEHDDDVAHLRSAIDSLPPKFRRVVWLRYAEELTFAEIGNKLHIPSTTAQTYFYRACAKLRLTLAPQYMTG